ncbi:hypothetical protein RCH22_003230 [Cryobacterium psychrotolerans]|nr:hypothetical protein [Cryobacterium psychrotolerans]
MSALDQPQELRRDRGARQVGQTGCVHRVEQGIGRPGRNQEPSPGFDGPTHEVRIVDRSGADDGVGHLVGDGADRTQCSRGAQRHLDDRKATRDECPSQCHRAVGILDDDDGDHGVP